MAQPCSCAQGLATGSESSKHKREPTVLRAKAPSFWPRKAARAARGCSWRSRCHSEPEGKRQGPVTGARQGRSRLQPGGEALSAPARPAPTSRLASAAPSARCDRPRAAAASVVWGRRGSAAGAQASPSGVSQRQPRCADKTNKGSLWRPQQPLCGQLLSGLDPV